MNTNEILRILKHNLDIKKKPKRSSYDYGWNDALDEIEKLVDQVLEDGEITWLSGAYDDRTAEAAESLDRDKWGRIKDDDFNPYLGPAFQRTKEEIHEQLKESIGNIIKDKVCETEDEAEERAYEELETFDGPMKPWPEITVKPITDETIDKIVERIKERWDEQPK